MNNVSEINNGVNETKNNQLEQFKKVLEEANKEYNALKNATSINITMINNLMKNYEDLEKVLPLLKESISPEIYSQYVDQIEEAEDYLSGFIEAFNYDAQRNSSTSRLEQFKRELQEFNEEMQRFSSLENIDDRKLQELISKCNDLQATLYSLGSSVDKNFIEQCDDQLENSIQYLKSIYRSLDKVDDITRGM